MTKSIETESLVRCKTSALQSRLNFEGEFQGTFVFSGDKLPRFVALPENTAAAT